MVKDKTEALFYVQAAGKVDLPGVDPDAGAARGMEVLDQAGAGQEAVRVLGIDAALDRMRSGLLRFLEHHGVDKGKYSETVTVFWIDKINEKLNELGPDVSLVDKCNTVLDTDFRV